MNNNRNVYTFEDYKCTPDPVFTVERECLEPCPAPIVVDNGSFQCRAGWASGAAQCDRPRLVFRSAAARSRGAARSDAHVGNDIASVEPLRWSLKSAFDRDAVVNFDIQELIFDYIFMHLGINTQVMMFIGGNSFLSVSVHTLFEELKLLTRHTIYYFTCMSYAYA